ncbi:adenylate cyclase-binding protein [Saccharomycopsis crataegensis]|uniref:Adenylyl cyclase-associated protein n=1 Tax=Saccharomycopsis crataegensis TaxID=43959 RepID=A0AAV5QJ28_9ASCO|nr:adenylate cyclase-binding protein [Saccharomycopsis crataegensis]
MAEKSSSYSVQGYNFVTLLKRLEAATSRLEDITIFQEQSSKAPEGENPSEVKEIAGDAPANLLATTTSGSPPPPPPPPPPAPVEEEDPVVTGFQTFIDKYLTPFETTSKKIDSELGDMVHDLVAGFAEEKDFLKIVSLSKMTPQEKLIPYIKPTQKKIESVMSFKESYRGKLSNHVNTINEYVPILGWIVVPCMGGNNKPLLSHIDDFTDSATFWSNRVMKEFKDTDKTHVEWVKQLRDISTGLKEYINEYHPTGLAWNIKEGVPIEDAAKKLSELKSSHPAASAAAAAAAGGPPPPPPPPPPASVFEITKEAAPASGMTAVFSALNQGTDITKGLRKVEKSEMTHKNPELRRTTSNSSTSSKKAPKPPKKPSSLSGSKVKAKSPPKKELVDSKWSVANFEDDHEIVIEGEMDHHVFIAKCTNCTIKIVGKVNAITVSECSKVGILTESLISGIDFIKTSKFQLQPLGFVPLISIDQSEDGEIYLGKNTLDSQIFTSKTTSLNVYCADPENDEADFTETPLAEQFVHNFDRKTGKFVSSVVEASG